MIFFNFVLDSFWVHASILTPFLAWNKSFHWLIDSFDICYYVGICHGGSDMLMSAYKRGLDFQLNRKLLCIKMNSPVSHIEMCHKVTFVQHLLGRNRLHYNSFTTLLTFPFFISCIMDFIISCHNFHPSFIFSKH